MWRNIRYLCMNDVASIYNRHVPPRLADFCLIEYDPLCTVHVLYFWKALGSEMLEIMFPGVLHGKTQMQIYKYSLYLNIVNDEMSVLTL